MALVADERVADHRVASDHVQMRRLRHRLDDLEAPAMLQRRDARARGGDFGRIDLGHDHARLGAAFGEDAAPRIDDQRMAEGLAAVLVRAALRGREHEAAVLDGARAHQHVPMRLAGLAA